MKRWQWFVAWFVVGATWSVAVLGAMTIGVFLLPVAALMTLALAMQRGAAVGLPGLISGLALPVLWVAYLNRSGPGTVCSTTADGGSQCVDEWSPWLPLVTGLVLLAIGVIVFARSLRRSDLQQDLAARAGGGA